jgi:hypothetical protein
MIRLEFARRALRALLFACVCLRSLVYSNNQRHSPNPLVSPPAESTGVSNSAYECQDAFNALRNLVNTWLQDVSVALSMLALIACTHDDLSDNNIHTRYTKPSLLPSTLLTMQITTLLTPPTSRRRGARTRLQIACCSTSTDGCAALLRCCMTPPFTAWCTR